MQRGTWNLKGNQEREVEVMLPFEFVPRTV